MIQVLDMLEQKPICHSIIHVIPILLCFTLTYSFGPESEWFGLWRALPYTWKWVCSHGGARYCTKHKSNPSTAVRPKVEACWSKNANIAHDGFGMLCRCRLLAFEASSCDVGRHVLSSLISKARFSNMLQEKKLIAEFMQVGHTPFRSVAAWAS